jgi:hypothetical protein
MTREEAAAMEPREVQILAMLGIADPYLRPARTLAVKAKSVKKKTVKSVKKTVAKKTVKKAARARRAKAA